MLASSAYKTTTSLLTQAKSVRIWSQGMILLTALSAAMTAAAATQHVVESGETLSELAQHYGVSKTALIDTNGLRATHIQIGQVLDIPEKDAQHNIYKIKAGDSLTGVAKKFGIALDDLATANNLSPQSGLLIDSTLIIPTKTNKKKTQVVTVARDIKVSDRRASSAKIEPLKESKTQANTQATKAVLTKTAAPVTTRNNKATRHRIAYGDSLLSIAKNYGVDVRALAATNDMGLDDTLYFGRYLTIPAVGHNVSTTKNERSAAKTASTKPSYYVVQRGDTLMGVANKFNTHFMQIAKLTNIDYNDHLAVGQKLILPKETVTSSIAY